MVATGAAAVAQAVRARAEEVVGAREGEAAREVGSGAGAT